VLIIKDQYKYALENNIEIQGSNQHAYRPNHCTTTACLELQSIIALELELNKGCVVYSVDLSAASDLLVPEIMERNLADLPTKLRRPLMDFLKDRQ